jgi:hypothetical protein
MVSFLQMCLLEYTIHCTGSEVVSQVPGDGNPCLTGGPGSCLVNGTGQASCLPEAGCIAPGSPHPAMRKSLFFCPFSERRRSIVS